MQIWRSPDIILELSWVSQYIYIYIYMLIYGFPVNAFRIGENIGRCTTITFCLPIYRLIEIQTDTNLDPFLLFCCSAQDGSFGENVRLHWGDLPGWKPWQQFNAVLLAVARVCKGSPSDMATCLADNQILGAITLTGSATCGSINLYTYLESEFVQIKWCIAFYLHLCF